MEIQDRIMEWLLTWLDRVMDWITGGLWESIRGDVTWNEIKIRK